MIGLGVRTPGGALEVLDLTDPRQPGVGELVLDMVAAGIGPWDALLHTGGWEVDLTPPAALGVEGAGRVAATGPGETEFHAGDLVLVHEAPLPGGSGTWGEKVLVHSANATRVPTGLALTIAAALPVAGLTALQSLDELQVGAGTRLLVVGASGPTASLAVQLAHRRGPRLSLERGCHTRIGFKSLAPSTSSTPTSKAGRSRLSDDSMRCLSRRPERQMMQYASSLMAVD